MYNNPPVTLLRRHPQQTVLDQFDCFDHKTIWSTNNMFILYMIQATTIRVVEATFFDKKGNMLKMSEKDRSDAMRQLEKKSAKQSFRENRSLTELNIQQRRTEPNNKIYFSKYKEEDRKSKNKTIKYIKLTLDDFSNEYKYIPTDGRLYNYYLEIGKPSQFKIRNVTVFHKNGRILYMYENIEFRPLNDTEYTDTKTGNIITDKVYDSREAALSQSTVSNNGFIVDKSTTVDTDTTNTVNIKRILLHKFTVSEYLQNKFKANLKNEIVQFNLKQIKNDDKVYVCLCQNKKCDGECTEVYRTFRRDLHDMNL
ncbi:hypothetical protein ECANGB1_1646 [Enterospora canceri]|uniref:Uncharacterized protein n=1 Tax=Enterospora canceri TaxID=1081671 RepID=A0A1Y1S945_9MICR|nr:hypothetical protein ECANGB1_1646 [Enterospora canceri]